MHVQPLDHPSATSLPETQPSCPFIDHAIIPHSEGSTLVGGQEQEQDGKVRLLVREANSPMFGYQTPAKPE